MPKKNNKNNKKKNKAQQPPQPNVTAATLPPPDSKAEVSSAQSVESLQQADNLVAQRQYDQAIKLLEGVISPKADVHIQIAAWAKLSEVYYRKGQIGIALTDINEAISLQEEHHCLDAELGAKQQQALTQIKTKLERTIKCLGFIRAACDPCENPLHEFSKLAEILYSGQHGLDEYGLTFLKRFFCRNLSTILKKFFGTDELSNQAVENFLQYTSQACIALELTPAEAFLADCQVVVIARLTRMVTAHWHQLAIQGDASDELKESATESFVNLIAAGNLLAYGEKKLLDSLRMALRKQFIQLLCNQSIALNNWLKSAEFYQQIDTMPHSVTAAAFPKASSGTPQLKSRVAELFQNDALYSEIKKHIDGLSALNPALQALYMGMAPIAKSADEAGEEKLDEAGIKAAARQVAFSCYLYALDENYLLGKFPSEFINDKTTPKIFTEEFNGEVEKWRAKLSERENQQDYLDRASASIRFEISVENVVATLNLDTDDSKAEVPCEQSVESPFQQADNLVEQQQYDEAINLLYELTTTGKSVEDRTLAFIKVSGINYREGYMDRALENIDEAIGLQNESPCLPDERQQFLIKLRSNIQELINCRNYIFNASLFPKKTLKDFAGLVNKLNLEQHSLDEYGLAFLKESFCQKFSIILDNFFATNELSAEEVECFNQHVREICDVLKLTLAEVLPDNPAALSQKSEGVFDQLVAENFIKNTTIDFLGLLLPMVGKISAGYRENQRQWFLQVGYESIDYILSAPDRAFSEKKDTLEKAYHVASKLGVAISTHMEIKKQTAAYIERLVDDVVEKFQGDLSGLSASDLKTNADNLFALAETIQFPVQNIVKKLTEKVQLLFVKYLSDSENSLNDWVRLSEAYQTEIAPIVNQHNSVVQRTAMGSGSDELKTRVAELFAKSDFIEKLCKVDWSENTTILQNILYASLDVKELVSSALQSEQKQETEQAKSQTIAAARQAVFSCYMHALNRSYQPWCPSSSDELYKLYNVDKKSLWKYFRGVLSGSEASKGGMSFVEKWKQRLSTGEITIFQQARQDITKRLNKTEAYFQGRKAQEKGVTIGTTHHSKTKAPSASAAAPASKKGKGKKKAKAKTNKGPSGNGNPPQPKKRPGTKNTQVGRKENGVSAEAAPAVSEGVQPLPLMRGGNGSTRSSKATLFQPQSQPQPNPVTFGEVDVDGCKEEGDYLKQITQVNHNLLQIGRIPAEGMKPFGANFSDEVNRSVISYIPQLNFYHVAMLYELLKNHKHGPKNAGWPYDNLFKVLHDIRHTGIHQPDWVDSPKARSCINAIVMQLHNVFKRISCGGCANNLDTVLSLLQKEINPSTVSITQPQTQQTIPMFEAGQLFISNMKTVFSSMQNLLLIQLDAKELLGLGIIFSMVIGCNILKLRESMPGNENLLSEELANKLISIRNKLAHEGLVRETIGEIEELIQPLGEAITDAPSQLTPAATPPPQTPRLG
jgi:predicted negative regulator of RcsB-dependent stress response